MKRIAAIALYVAATLITTGSAMAQDHGAKATVPFNFNVAGTWVPAGTYTIGSDSRSAGPVSLKDHEANISLWAIGQIDANEPGKAGELVFHKYGDRYFLSEIRYAHSSLKVCFGATKAEKRAKEEALEQAALPANDNVLIALN